ncbi:hypothetical protein JQC67_14965 [Aurantibacter crassamenti]|uniref:sensor histidine kinase n=1 Tax=Aurantibacter crassamenti TaxID=1837375 RepID=UPI00193A1356|nr:ATP-binding protein [Aurantibacter crassamenti]MBM1107453.1 hypothetical protein [Aurantibacter crassamenti]
MLITLFFSCSNEATQKKNIKDQAQSDSLQYNISQGTNRSISIIERQNALKKAFITATKIKEDTLRLKHFTKIQWAYAYAEDSLQFRKINKKTNKLAIQLNDSLRLGISYWDLGTYLDNLGIKDSAYYNLSQAQEIFININQYKRAGSITYHMAKIQEDIKDYTGSEINTIKAIELLSPLDENYILAQCYNLLGIVAKDLEEFDRATLHYRSAEEYLLKAGANYLLESQINNNIGVNFLEKGDTKNATTYFNKILYQDSLFYKYPDLYAKTLNNLARSRYKANANTEVTKLFQKSLKIRDSIGDIAGLAGGYLSLAEYNLFKKDSAVALLNLLKSKENAELSQNNSRLLESLELLTQIDPKNAAIYSKQYITLNDSLIHEEAILRNKFARIRFETDQVVAENKQLESQKQLWAGIAVSILLLGTAGYVIIDQRVKNQRLRFQQAQQASDKKIVDLMLSEKQKFEEGKKMEQKRISEELHDGILGKMLGARMVLTGLNKKSDDEAINIKADALIALKDIESEVRSISHELSHAAYLQLHNFTRSISDLLENSASAANINHIFNFDSEIAWDNLNGDIKINLYRIIQECIHNAVKHSECKNITLDFTVENDKLLVIIEDDGIGFNTDKTKKKGIGRLNLQSRIDKLNGNWKIDSSLGQGTAVKLSIPVEYFSDDSENFDTLEKK